MSPFLVFLLACFSVHACNARFLGLISHNQITRTKDVEKVDLNALESKEVSNIDCPKTHESSPGASTNMNQKNLLALFNDKGLLITKENEHLIVSSQKNLPQKIKIKDMKKQGRMMLGSAASDVEEAAESKEKDITEDIEVMDYAQPHRKPPIHNEKP